MMLGKRPRYPIKRNTSMNEFTTLDLNTTFIEERPSNPCQSPSTLARNDGLENHRILTSSLSMSPRNFRRNSIDFLADNSHFLKSCLLCKRRLVPGRDIYMYRGDSAFCSAECREKQMKQDERKEKCSVSASNKKDSPTTAVASSAVKSQFST